MDYHLDRYGPGGDLVYYDPWMRVKIHAQTAKYRASASRFVPDDVPMGWGYVQKDAPRTHLDTSYDYLPGHIDKSDGYVRYNHYYGERGPLRHYMWPVLIRPKVGSRGIVGSV